MTKILATALIALVLGTASAVAQTVPPAPAAKNPLDDAGVRAYVVALKACLVSAKVPLDGDRPDCYVDGNVHLQCLATYREVGAKCREAALPKKPATALSWDIKKEEKK